MLQNRFPNTTSDFFFVNPQPGMGTYYLLKLKFLLELVPMVGMVGVVLALEGDRAHTLRKKMFS